jgi:hypothetical protein
VGNAAIAYKNWLDECTLSLGTYNASFPRDNIKNIQKTKVARTSSAASANTLFAGVLTTTRPVAVFGVFGLNSSRNGQYRFTGYSDTGLSVEVYNSGLVDVFPGGMWPYGALEWEDPRFWDGRPLTEDLAYLPNEAIHWLEKRTLIRSWKFELFDTANAAGYVEFGRAFIGDAWQPGVNMAYGAKLYPVIEDLSEVIETEGGQEYSFEGDVRRGVAFELKRVTEAETMHVYALQRIAKSVNEVLWLWDPEDPPSFARRAMRGRLRDCKPTDHPEFRNNTVAFDLQESL